MSSRSTDARCPRGGPGRHGNVEWGHLAQGEAPPAASNLLRSVGAPQTCSMAPPAVESLHCGSWLSQSPTSESVPLSESSPGRLYFDREGDAQTALSVIFAARCSGGSGHRAAQDRATAVCVSARASSPFILCIRLQDAQGIRKPSEGFFFGSGKAQKVFQIT